ncbi:MAG: hypothetical protein KBH07_05180 [Flavobacteriales bacterium]|nr:hypothetical protein [Flavobacteriales bacterium]
MPIQIHGHRGCSGHFPANSIEAFLAAARTGCHWLEMDVVITGDKEVLVSHEPWMDHVTCLGPHGGPLTEAQGLAANIHRMTLAQVRRYRLVPDDGLAPWKPTLAEVHAQVQGDCAERSVPMPRFNIEVKSEPAWYGTFQPAPADVAGRVALELRKTGLDKHGLVQSFDPAILLAMHRINPAIPLALLVENTAGLAYNLGLLDFTPAYYAPSFELINEALVAELRARGMGVLAWTVNKERDLRRMIDLGVDGLITDHPAAAMALLAGDH